MLAATHHLMMYDLRGHGRSSMPRDGYDLQRMARDLVGLLDSLAIERADIVGHSFGGRVALVFAALYPHRVRNLVIADTQIRALQPPLRLSEWPHWPRWRAELQANGLENPPSDDTLIDHDLLVRLSQHRNAPAKPNQLARISLRVSAMGDKGLRAGASFWPRRAPPATSRMNEFLVPSNLASVSAPTLLMFGKFSHCLPTADGLLQCLPNARLLIIPGAGHFFPLVRARFFARATERFLMRQQAGGGRLAALRRPLRRRFAAIAPA